MHTPSQIFGVVVASLVLLVAPASAIPVATPATASTYAGGVDMQAACRQQYGNQNEQGISGGPGAYDWYCKDPRTGATGRVDVARYCADTYGNTAYADAQGDGAFDWGCFYP